MIRDNQLILLIFLPFLSNLVVRKSTELWATIIKIFEDGCPHGIWVLIFLILTIMQKQLPFSNVNLKLTMKFQVVF